MPKTCHMWYHPYTPNSLHATPSSYQLNIAPPNSFPYPTPPQHPHIAPLEFDVSHTALALNLDSSSIAQHATENRSVLVGLVDHADAAGRVVELLQRGGKGLQEGGVVVGAQEGLVVVQVLLFEVREEVGVCGGLLAVVERVFVDLRMLSALAVQGRNR